MKAITIILLVMILVLGWMLFHNPESGLELNLAPTTGSLNVVSGNSLMAMSPVYIPRVEVLASIITTCESQNKHDGIWGDKGMAYGIAQFWEDTFYWMAEKAGLENPDWKNQNQQEWLLRWAIINDLEKHWTCNPL